VKQLTKDGFVKHEVAHHFESADQEFQTAKLGMWLFLGQELLFFSALFVAYGVFRFLYPAMFIEAHHHLSVNMGFLNTIVLLITSVPLFLFFFFNIVIFYVIFICYISLGVLVYCCFKVKDRDTDLNVIKAEKKIAYTAIN